MGKPGWKSVSIGPSCLSVTNIASSFLVSRWNQGISWPSVLHDKNYKTLFFDIDLGPLTPKIACDNTSPPVVALSARQLCLGKVGNPLNFGADPCCHGNEIWARHGDPVAYRLVYCTYYVAFLYTYKHHAKFLPLEVGLSSKSSLWSLLFLALSTSFSWIYRVD